MARRGDIDGSRASQMIRDKAQPAENVGALFKGWNAVLDHLARSLRASRKAVVRSVAPFGKGEPLPERRALRPTALRLAGLFNIVTAGH